MDAELLDTITRTGIAGAILYLLGAGAYLGFRLARWVKRAERPRERVFLLLRRALAFALLHGATLVVGGVLFVLLARLLGGLDAAERDQYGRNARFCLACGSALATLAVAGLWLTPRARRRAGAPA